MPMVPGLVVQTAILLIARWILPLDSLISIALVSGMAGTVFVATWFKTDAERPPVPGKIIQLWERMIAGTLPGSRQRKAGL